MHDHVPGSSLNAQPGQGTQPCYKAPSELLVDIYSSWQQSGMVLFCAIFYISNANLLM